MHHWRRLIFSLYLKKNKQTKGANKTRNIQCAKLSKIWSTQFDASMALVNPCSPWGLLVTNWLDDPKIEIKLGKLSNRKPKVDLEKEATFSKFKAKPNLEPNYTFNKANNQKNLPTTPLSFCSNNCCLIAIENLKLDSKIHLCVELGIEIFYFQKNRSMW